MNHIEEAEKFFNSIKGGTWTQSYSSKHSSGSWKEVMTVRIRGIKTEFWRSDDIAALDWFDQAKQMLMTARKAVTE